MDSQSHEPSANAAVKCEVRQTHLTRKLLNWSSSFTTVAKNVRPWVRCESVLFETASCPGFDINPSMASIVIKNLGLESLGRSVESSLNMMDFAVPFVLGVMAIEVECNLILC